MPLAGLAVYVLWDKLCVEKPLQHHLLGSFILGLYVMHASCWERMRFATALLLYSKCPEIPGLSRRGLNLTDWHCPDDKISSLTTVVVLTGFS